MSFGPKSLNLDSEPTKDSEYSRIRYIPVFKITENKNKKLETNRYIHYYIVLNVEVIGYDTDLPQQRIIYFT